MKKRLRHFLPEPVRKCSRRIIVRFVGLAVNLVKDILNIASTNGLDLSLQWKSTTSVSDHGRREGAPQSFGVQDFLFLMDIVRGLPRPGTSRAQGKIRTSIIIPVYNQANYTFQCLRSLISEIDLNFCEIIVVNNASQDETSRLLSYFDGLVTVIDNRENRGFGDACNQGAAVARGEYLVFLNNDTIIQPGWLTHLVDTAEADLSVGAVGSMLIYPDGILQEAGGIIWKDGTGANYGRGENPIDRKFIFAREVDYCSGASLLVRKNLFEELGGFDQRYAPAYYEDTDLCFGIRALGYKVVYQPTSRVIHYERATAGVDLNSGFKRYQQINRTKFVEKWRDVLEKEHIEFDPEMIDLAAERRRGPRIMVFDQMVPKPDEDSGSLRMFMILKALARKARPVFVPVNLSTSKKYELLLGKEGVEIIGRDQYTERLGSSVYDLAVLSRPTVADEILPTLRKLDKNLKIIFDTVDIHYIRLQRESEITGDRRYAEEAARFKKKEIRAAASCDQIWCVTPADRDVLNEELPSANVRVVPNIHKLHSRGLVFDERRDLLFVGGFKHRPNEDALRFYINEILPHVRALLPGVKLFVVGSNMSEEIHQLASEDVIILGYQPDLEPLFNRTRVFVAPLRYGSGMKGKIGQALSHGVPVVTTHIGAEGMQLRNGHVAMLADSARELAEAIARVYTDRGLWQHVSEKGYKHIGELFSPSVVDRQITRALDEVRQGLKLSEDGPPVGRDLHISEARVTY